MKLTDQQLQEMYEWYQARKAQAIPFPLDQASKNSLPGAVGAGLGSHALTQVVAVATVPPSNINVPAAYAGTVLVTIEGVTYELPYIQTQ